MPQVVEMVQVWRASGSLPRNPMRVTRWIEKTSGVGWFRVVFSFVAQMSGSLRELDATLSEEILAGRANHLSRRSAGRFQG
jgi:hypothetical protein